MHPQGPWRANMLIRYQRKRHARTQAGEDITAVLSQKGGTGESHTVRSPAVAGDSGRPQGPAIIDADPQGTVIAWAKHRKHNAPHVVALGSHTIASQIEALKGQGSQLIVIDTPPHAQPIINMAAEFATACLIITGAFLEELETVAAVAAIARSLHRPAAIALKIVASRSHALTLARTALGTFGIPVCPTAMAHSSRMPMPARKAKPLTSGIRPESAAQELAECLSVAQYMLIRCRRNRRHPGRRVRIRTGSPATPKEPEPTTPAPQIQPPKGRGRGANPKECRRTS